MKYILTNRQNENIQNRIFMYDFTTLTSGKTVNNLILFWFRHFKRKKQTFYQNMQPNLGHFSRITKN